VLIDLVYKAFEEQDTEEVHFKRWNECNRYRPTALTRRTTTGEPNIS
jgi:hypothetical protein